MVALIDMPFRPYPASVLMNNALDDGQAHAGSFKFLNTMQALENAQELLAYLMSKPTPLSRTK